ncbi:MAG: hypothetical protein ACREBF_04360 [Candidatus Micrarchaeales archaeon]
MSAYGLFLLTTVITLTLLISTSSLTMLKVNQVQGAYTLSISIAKAETECDALAVIRLPSTSMCYYDSIASNSTIWYKNERKEK